MTDESPNTNYGISRTSLFIRTILLGVTNSNLALLFEHPIETIKTQWQRKNQLKKFTDVGKFIYSESGLKGFYKGLTPNLLYRSIRNSFRWPTMIFLPNKFKSLTEELPFYIDSLPKILTAMTIAFSEVYILTPLERVKIFLMTETSNIFNFYALHKNSLKKELFRGIGPSLWKVNVAWFSFIISDHYLKLLWKDTFNRKVLSMYDLLIISFGVGLSCTIACMPFDFVKTQAQMEKKNKSIELKGTLRPLYHYISNRQVGILYTGWKLRLSQFVINSIVSVSLLEKLENDYQKLHDFDTLKDYRRVNDI